MRDSFVEANTMDNTKHNQHEVQQPAREDGKNKPNRCDREVGWGTG